MQRGIAGFGTHGIMQRENPAHISRALPMKNEVVEKSEAIAQALEWIQPMVSEGLVTVREVDVREMKQ